MLGSETKQKIKNLRDTLVGKIPVPTEQVKQITLGLIYKFMSDIDQENKELGSKSFFRGDYEKYSWHKIMDRGLSSYDRVLLYSEGLEKMILNPNIPQLFRDIFKGAFLPFRDPAIVNEFLKGINEFKYEHSEDLGDAFEFLLMVMDAQGDAGQFRTPRHIIDFIVQAVGPQKTDKILDPACGTAGFLVGAYKHILKQNTAPNSSRPGSALTTTQRNNLSKNFVGYDISHDMVRLSLVNMYLHQFSDPKIYEYDTLTSLDRWEDNFDCILANPPFMTPRGGIRPHNRFAIRANRSEVLFVDYIAEHLNPSGKAGIIVPEGIIFQSSNAYKALRKMLVDNGYLYAVVSLPTGVFNPYSGVKTSILLIDKTLAKKTEDILFVKVENDGFDLGAQRRQIEQNDLPQSLEIITRYKQTLIEGEKANFLTKYKDFAQVTPKEKIAKDEDYNLSRERHKEPRAFLNKKFLMITLDEIFLEIKNGKNVKQFDEKGKYRVSRIQTISDWVVDLNKTKWTNDEVKKEYFLEEGDILLSHINSMEHLAKSALFLGIHEKVVHGVNLIRLRPNKEKISPLFVSFIFRSENFLRKARSFAQKAVNQASIKVSDLKNIKIPLPPFEIQQEIVAELNGYQKIIDGAKQVVENYKPQIDINPDWKKDVIGNVIKTITPPKKVQKNEYLIEGKFPIIDQSQNDIAGWTNNEEALVKISDPVVIFGDHTCVIKYSEKPFVQGADGIKILSVDKSLVPKYLYFYLISDSLRPDGYKRHFQDLQRKVITIPSLEIQKQIVAQIEEEQKLIQANKKVIAVFEQKIKDKIKEVWGE